MIYVKYTNVQYNMTTKQLFIYTIKEIKDIMSTEKQWNFPL